MVKTVFILDRTFYTRHILTTDKGSKNTFWADLFCQEFNTGAETFEFECYAHEYVVEGNYIAFYYNNEYKLFTIAEKEDEHKEGKIISKCYCETGSLTLLNNYIRPFSNEMNCIQFFDYILYNTNWTIGKYSDKLENKIATVEEKDIQSVWSLIEEYKDVFGYELDVRIDYENGHVTGFYIDLYDEGELGSVTDKRFEYGRNVTGITRTKDIYEWCTGIIIDSKCDVNNTLVDINQGYGFSKGAGDVLIDEDYNEIYNAGRTPILGVYKGNETEPMEACINAWKELQRRKAPKFTYEVDAVLLDEEFSNIHLGDTVNVIDHTFSPPLLLEARVGELELSFTDNTQNKCKLTNYKEVRSRLVEVEQDQEGGGVNLIPNPSALLSIGDWGAMGSLRAYRYINTENFIPPITNNSKPYIDDDDLYGNAELHCLATDYGGLAMVIRDCTGKIILIDGGYATNAPKVISYLESMGVKCINYYIITHFHSDHAECSEQIIRHFDCEKVIFKTLKIEKLPEIEFDPDWRTDSIYNSFVATCNELDIEMENPQVFPHIKLSNNSEIIIHNTDNGDYSDYNHQSLMIEYRYKNNKCLLCGDGTENSSYSIRDRIGKVDIMQMGHHGDGTIGGTPRFLIDECRPRFAYFASIFLANYLTYGNDYKNVSRVFKDVSWFYGLSMTHGAGNGDFKYVMDGTNVVTNGKTVFAKNLWYEREPGIWFYFKEDGYVARNQWLEINNDWFYFGDDYAMYKNKWYKDSQGNWFYLKDNGAMAKDETLSINGKKYTFASTGQCVNP